MKSLNTDKRLLAQALILINRKEMPLETAIELAKDDTGLEILDNLKTIRTYLCEMKLLEHNPRLTFLIEEEMQKEKILFNTEKVEPTFLNDFVTDNCSQLISIGQLVYTLQK